ncbi:exopolysaccharide Pel transporter PelG [Cytobacillus suaedae]|nr:exopolysaccharide Pel transporter PelG [Cytobacillus suaedae]
MAGIGFQLKKLFNENGLFNTIRAYSYSAVVTIGPMALCILLITVAQNLLEAAGTSYAERQLFTAAVQYAFIFSQILTGGFNLILSRFVADKTFLKKEDEVLSSLYGSVAICIMIGGVSSWIFYKDSPLPISFKLASYLLFTELIIIWLQCMYVSALKDYLKIVKSFMVGTSVSILSVLACIYLFEWNNAFALLLCFNLGFLTIILRFMSHIREFFSVNDQDYFQFLSYLEKYPLLFLGGMFYTFGLYGHNIVVWQGELQVIIQETFLVAPYYDVPVFFAYLTILPALVIFMVSVETSFYEKYKAYYERILQSSPLKDILNAKQDLYSIIRIELAFITEIQLIVMICSIAAGIELLPLLGLTLEQIHIFIIVTIGNLFFVLMYTIVLLLLYFDDQKGAFGTTLFFGMTSTIFTIVALYLDHYGFSIFFASALSLLIVISRFASYLNNLDYYTFCAQPLVFKEKVLRTDQFLEKFRDKNK